MVNKNINLMINKKNLLFFCSLLLFEGCESPLKLEKESVQSNSHPKQQLSAKIQSSPQNNFLIESQEDLNDLTSTHFETIPPEVYLNIPKLFSTEVRNNLSATNKVLRSAVALVRHELTLNSKDLNQDIFSLLFDKEKGAYRNVKKLSFINCAFSIDLLSGVAK